MALLRPLALARGFLLPFSFGPASALRLRGALVPVAGGERPAMVVVGQAREMADETIDAAALGLPLAFGAARGGGGGGKKSRSGRGGGNRGGKRQTLPNQAPQAPVAQDRSSGSNSTALGGRGNQDTKSDGEPQAKVSSN